MICLKHLWPFGRPSDPVQPIMVLPAPEKPKRSDGDLASLLRRSNTYEAAVLRAMLNNGPMSGKDFARYLSAERMYPNCILSAVNKVTRKLRKAGYPVNVSRVNTCGKAPYKQWFLSDETKRKLREAKPCA